jgi:hypothetical protein
LRKIGEIANVSYLAHQKKIEFAGVGSFYRRGTPNNVTAIALQSGRQPSIDFAVNLVNEPVPDSFRTQAPPCAEIGRAKAGIVMSSPSGGR